MTTVAGMCPYCGHPAVPGEPCGAEDAKPGSRYAETPPRHRMCPYALVKGRIGVVGRELSGKPVMVLPGDDRAPG